MESENEQITMVTGLTDVERKKALRWFADHSDATKLSIFSSLVRINYQIQHDYPALSGPIRRFCALIKSIRQAGWDQMKQEKESRTRKRQRDDLTLSPRDEVIEKIRPRRGRPPTIRHEVDAFWGEVIELASAGNSFTTISEYLLKKRKVKVSSSHLAALYKRRKETIQ